MIVTILFSGRVIINVNGTSTFVWEWFEYARYNVCFNEWNVGAAKTTASTERRNRFARLHVSDLSGAITYSPHEGTINDDEENKNEK